ncbi:hypothetical protein PP182_17420 [Maribacter sp. PR1]|uniref:Competence protein n=1 Tax=Maribacter cobaltidurans TaxID=1178778 RepID=A0ABU7IXY8_9FLAO|nr:MULTISPECIES: hypothetical protein [Maribacter]MDC6390473.1 hypothetical protein [Maribacter sp. PR1]MEE1977862.1 hypothetical protein [Maribacter cobaltidurans]
MKEEDYKAIIGKSEVNTNVDFTDKLMSKIESRTQLEKQVEFWSVRQIAVGFVLIAVISGFLSYNISVLFVIKSSAAIPLLWSLILLLGLSYLLSINRCQSSLSSKI